MLNPAKADARIRNKEKIAANVVAKGTRAKTKLKRRYLGVGELDTQGYPAFLFQVDGKGELPRQKELASVYVRNDNDDEASRTYCSLTPGRLAGATMEARQQLPGYPSASTKMFAVVAQKAVQAGLDRERKTTPVTTAQRAALKKSSKGPKQVKELESRLSWFNRLVDGAKIEADLPLASIGLNLGLSGRATWGDVREQLPSATDYTDQVESPPEPSRKAGDKRSGSRTDECYHSHNDFNAIEVPKLLVLRRRRQATSPPPAPAQPSSPRRETSAANPPRAPSPPPARKDTPPAQTLLRLDGRDFKRQYDELRQTAVLLADIAAASSRHRPSPADHLFIQYHAGISGRGMVVGVSRALRSIALYNDHGTGRVWTREPMGYVKADGKRQFIFSGGLVAPSLMTCLNGGAAAGSGTSTATSSGILGTTAAAAAPAQLVDDPNLLPGQFDDDYGFVRPVQ